MEKTIYDYLKLNMEKYGEKTAVVCGDNHINFNELYDKTVATAMKILKDYGRYENVFVIENDRSIETVVLMLSVVVSGNCYRVVNSPFMAYDDDIILSKNYIEEIYMEYSEFTRLQIINDALGSMDVTKPMYEIFTSGTTGEPKKIVKNQGDLLEFIEDFVTKFNLGSGDVFLNQLEFTFDASTKDIYSMVVLGATMCIAQRKEINFPSEFMKCLMENNITVFITTPFFIKNITRLNGLTNACLPKLRYVMFVGENMKAEYMNYWLEVLKNVSFINLYGSSELAGNSLYYIVKDKVKMDYVPLRECFLDYEYEVKENELVLYRKSKKLIYHTGDMAKLSDNDVLLLGRCDNIRKVRGYRISLEMIENQLVRIDGVKEALCEHYEDNIYVLLVSDKANLDIRGVHKEIQHKLPKYVQPLHMIQVNRLPTNTNGKSDRRRIMDYFR